MLKCKNLPIYFYISVISLVITLFCTNKRLGWGWDNLVNEANQGKGIKIKNWMKPIFKYFVPICVLTIYIMGLVMFNWK